MAAIVRWIARLFGIGMILLFAVFLIGEELNIGATPLSVRDVLLLLCIPVLLIIGIIVAWKKEFKGGIIIIASVVIFNIIAMFFSNKMNFDFWYIFVLGFLFIFSFQLNSKSI